MSESAPDPPSEADFAGIYDLLRVFARAKVKREPVGSTLQATDVVHEAFLKLSDFKANDRKHLFLAAVEAMRRVLIDRARRRNAGKRGGKRQRVPLDAVKLCESHEDGLLLELREAIAELEKQRPNEARIINLRFVGGLSFEEIGQQLDMKKDAVRRRYLIALGLLHRYFKEV